MASQILPVSCFAFWRWSYPNSQAVGYHFNVQFQQHFLTYSSGKDNFLDDSLNSDCTSSRGILKRESGSESDLFPLPGDGMDEMDFGKVSLQFGKCIPGFTFVVFPKDNTFVFSKLDPSLAVKERKHLRGGISYQSLKNIIYTNHSCYFGGSDFSPVKMLVTNRGLGCCIKVRNPYLFV